MNREDRTIAAALGAIAPEGRAELESILRAAFASTRKPKTYLSRRTVPILDGPAVAAAWLDAETLEEVATKFGCSRERVRQLCDAQLPRWEIVLHKRRVQARRKLRSFVEATPKEQTLRDCIVCGHAFMAFRSSDGWRRSCSRSHRQVFQKLALHLPDYREKHRGYVAQRNLTQGATRYLRESAARVLDGTVGYHGRWLIEGSEVQAMAREAYRNGWPIVQLLPSEIQEQLRAEAS